MCIVVLYCSCTQAKSVKDGHSVARESRLAAVQFALRGSGSACTSHRISTAIAGEKGRQSNKLTSLPVVSQAEERLLEHGTK